MRRLVQLAAAFALIASSGSASAAPCAGFQDLDDSSAFCANVAWLKNRAITLGCTTVPVPAYCPDDKVLRSSMAAPSSFRPADPGIRTLLRYLRRS